MLALNPLSNPNLITVGQTLIVPAQGSVPSSLTSGNPRTDGYNSNGSDGRSMARDYYDRVGYPWWNK